ncbi:MAG: pilus (MSHA type) biogenesis protein MshL [Kangiellaceae bacterium]|nr:pilus (MSHA type) biogenesis protein MshL [Kangiellaceae bacterium]MCW8999641.1 pilus (MSHA type) biogenesis protein MshL [Kangiellaceae bacterium]MCW9015767.1 pilus (MSHA type) biogenesis protein MshL [Kangiellaceae bacterium]
MKNLVSVFVFCSLLTSCQTFMPVEREKVNLAADAIAEVEKQHNQSQAPISNEEMLNSLIPPLAIEETEIEEDRFDVSVKNIDARSFLLSLVEGTTYNMVVSPEVKGKISLQLKNVTVAEVLSATERIYPLMVEQDGNMFFVSSAESMTAIYPVDYLNISRVGRSKTNVAGQAVATQSGGGGNQQSGGGNQQGGQSSVSQINASEIETESNVDFWKELKQSLNLIVRNEPNANVVVSPHAGIVVVRAMPNTQRLIKEYLGATQQGLNRQVILEAKIVEVILNESFQAGIDWRKVNIQGDGDSFIFGQQGQVLQTAPSDAPLNGVFSALYQGSDFDAAIELLKAQGDVQVLSSPRVSTVNNQKAVIKVGSDEFFVTDVSTTTVTGTSTATTPDVTLTPFFSGISLDVTPQINRHGEIVLHIHPIISEVADQQKTLTLGQDQFSLPLALTNVRESDSIVRTNDKQVIVIGGLMQNRIQTDVNSVPLLGDIPVVGSIFSQNREFMVKSELVILLKASLVDHNSTQDELNQVKKRFNQL